MYACLHFVSDGFSCKFIDPIKQALHIVRRRESEHILRGRPSILSGRPSISTNGLLRKPGKNKLPASYDLARTRRSQMAAHIPMYVLKKSVVHCKKPAKTNRCLTRLLQTNNEVPYYPTMT